MRRESHVRFCESVGVKLPHATHPICHCRTRQEAEELKSALERRFADCHLLLHPEKTKVVYCADSN
jgi:RNA-directed DNA polymerase